MTSGESFAWGFALFMIVSVYGFYFAMQQFLRSSAIKKAVVERDWIWTGDSLPMGLRVREVFGSMGEVKISNAFQGRKGIIDFVGFDCVVGEGRSRSRFSMIGACSAINCFGAEKFDSSLEVLQWDDWCVIRRTIRGVEMHRPGCFFMTAKEMVSIIDSIG
jgi:hypothetical protein